MRHKPRTNKELLRIHVAENPDYFLTVDNNNLSLVVKVSMLLASLPYIRELKQTTTTTATRTSENKRPNERNDTCARAF